MPITIQLLVDSYGGSSDGDAYTVKVGNDR